LKECDRRIISPGLNPGAVVNEVHSKARLRPGSVVLRDAQNIKSRFSIYNHEYSEQG
jgi:hypothetical protein